MEQNRYPLTVHSLNLIGRNLIGQIKLHCTDFHYNHAKNCYWDMYVCTYIQGTQIAERK